MNRACALCGKVFPLDYQNAAQCEGTPSQKMFCDEKCRNSWWTGQPDHPTVEKVEPDWPNARELRLKRNAWVQMSKADPYRAGEILPIWKRADEVYNASSEMLLSGGNRSSKTFWAARKVVDKLLEEDGRNVLCCHTSSGSSLIVQQPAVYHYLPLELRATKKGRVHYLSYTQKNGFTADSFILPNGSHCAFLNYTQSSQNIEGRELDLVWCDELVPKDWVETLRYRLINRHGKLLVTQTPLEGVASIYGEFIAGSDIVEWSDASLLAGREGVPGWPKGKVPRRMDCRNKSRKVFFFFTEDNPYTPFAEVRTKLEGAPVSQILLRAYGWAIDNVGKAFPRFRPEVHVIPRERIPPGGTLYMVTDPAGARNWFCLWARVYPDGKMIIVKEFPEVPGYGEWAVTGSKPDGVPGPAQRNGAARGISEYRDLFRVVERELAGVVDENSPVEEPMMRLIDPKAGGTPALSEEGGTTLIDLLATDSENDSGMAFIPAPGVMVDQRIAAINSLLYWDATQPRTAINEPKLYVVDTCENLIWALSEYTGTDGQKGASKDPIDCLGMLTCSSLEHVGAGGLQCVGGGSY